MWRGIASFGVLIHHLYSQKGLFTSFYLFVQVFFVISGYCLAAAAERALASGMTFGQFMRRRVRRIAPPYLASCLFAMVLLGAGGVISGVGFRRLTVPWWHYAANLTMTQWLYLPAHGGAQTGTVPWATPVIGFLSPTYWSLNYEEQFYLIMAHGLVAGLRSRWVFAMGGITAVALALNAWHPRTFTGLFFDYWIEFAVGIAVYVRLCMPRSKRANHLFDAIFASAIVVAFALAARRGELVFDANKRQMVGQLAFCVAYGGLLIAVRPADDWVGRSNWSRPLMWLGTFSYSLYLIHYPLISAAKDFTASVPPAHEMVVLPLIGAAILAVSYGFHRLFEEPFLNSRERDAPRAVVDAVPV